MDKTINAIRFRIMRDEKENDLASSLLPENSDIDIRGIYDEMDRIEEVLKDMREVTANGGPKYIPYTHT